MSVRNLRHRDRCPWPQAHGSLPTASSAPGPGPWAPRLLRRAGLRRRSPLPQKAMGSFPWPHPAHGRSRLLSSALDSESTPRHRQPNPGPGPSPPRRRRPSRAGRCQRRARQPCHILAQSHDAAPGLSAHPHGSTSAAGGGRWGDDSENVRGQGTGQRPLAHCHYGRREIIANSRPRPADPQDGRLGWRPRSKVTLSSTRGTWRPI